LAATFTGVERAFEDAKSRRPDFLIVTVSGHAGPTSICLSDGPCDHATLAGWIRSAGCKKAALIIDACHAASIAPKFGFAGMGAPLDEPWSALYENMMPGFRLLLSSRADQLSSDGTGRNGLFTAALLKGLRTLPGDLTFEGGRYITAEAAIAYASNLVTRVTNGRQTPQAFGRNADFPLARPRPVTKPIPQRRPVAATPSRSPEGLTGASILGTIALGLLGGYVVSKLPTYDRNLGRYRRSNGQFL
jgi:hypothetical protein